MASSERSQGVPELFLIGAGLTWPGSLWCLLGLDRAETVLTSKLLFVHAGAYCTVLRKIYDQQIRVGLRGMRLHVLLS